MQYIRQAKNGIWYAAMKGKDGWSISFRKGRKIWGTVLQLLSYDSNKGAWKQYASKEYAAASLPQVYDRVFVRILAMNNSIFPKKWEILFLYQKIR